MDFFDAVARRRSVRSYKRRPVEPERVTTILEAANAAPSAGNLQAYEIFVVEDPARKKALARAALNQAFVAAAPVVLVFCARPARSASYGIRGQQLYAVQDATIACAFAMLAATASGLATVWVGAFEEDDVRKAIDAPDGDRPVAILPLGYSAEHPAAAPRRRTSDLVHRL